MLEFRVIPVLTILDGELVKTIKFKNPNYIGDPINAVRIFNLKEVDELALIDIGISKGITHEIDFNLIEEIVSESFMPISYGGGINSIDEVETLFRIGIEKIILNSSLLDFELINKISSKFGEQSLVACIDYKKDFFGKRKIYLKSGKSSIKLNFSDLISDLSKNGVGEFIFHRIDFDGVMSGYDFDGINDFINLTEKPSIILGGASGSECLNKIKTISNLSGSAASSIFVYKGNEKGILINYYK